MLKGVEEMIVEFIESYRKEDGDDYHYIDNHGILVRCRDCYWHSKCRFEQGLGLNGFCSKGERREDETAD